MTENKLTFSVDFSSAFFPETIKSQCSSLPNNLMHFLLLMHKFLSSFSASAPCISRSLLVRKQA